MAIRGLGVLQKGGVEMGCFFEGGITLRAFSDVDKSASGGVELPLSASEYF